MNNRCAGAGTVYLCISALPASYQNGWHRYS